MKTYRPNTVIVVNPKTSRIEIMMVFPTRDRADNFLQVSTESGADSYLWTGKQWIDIFGESRQFELIERGGWNYLTTFSGESIQEPHISGTLSEDTVSSIYGSETIEDTDDFDSKDMRRYLDKTTRLRQN